MCVVTPFLNVLGSLPWDREGLFTRCVLLIQFTTLDRDGTSWLHCHEYHHHFRNFANEACLSDPRPPRRRLTSLVTEVTVLCREPLGIGWRHHSPRRRRTGTPFGFQSVRSSEMNLCTAYRFVVTASDTWRGKKPYSWSLLLIVLVDSQIKMSCLNSACSFCLNAPPTRGKGDMPCTVLLWSRSISAARSFETSSRARLKWCRLGVGRARLQWDNTYRVLTFF